MTQALRRPELIDDERLARVVTGGDSGAFSVLYERYHARLYRYCRSILRSDADAHDAVQSTFTRALDALRQDQRDAPVRPWLFRIAHNEAISAIRRRTASDSLVARVELRGISAEDRSRAREQLGSLLADLRELPERPQGAIIMREFSGLSHAEIAVALGTTVSGVKHAIFEARRALIEFAVGRQMACQEVRRVIAEDDQRVLRGRRIHAHLRDCPECAVFAGAMRRRSGRLRVLALPAWAGAIWNQVSRRLRPELSRGAEDPTLATGVLAGAAAKLTAVLVSKAAIIAAGLATAGTMMVGLANGSNQPTSHASTPSALTWFVGSPPVATGRAVPATTGGSVYPPLTPGVSLLGRPTPPRVTAPAGARRIVVTGSNPSGPHSGRQPDAGQGPEPSTGGETAAGSATGGATADPPRPAEAASIVRRGRPAGSGPGTSYAGAAHHTGRGTAGSVSHGVLGPGHRNSARVDSGTARVSPGGPAAAAPADHAPPSGGPPQGPDSHPEAGAPNVAAAASSVSNAVGAGMSEAAGTTRSTPTAPTRRIAAP